MSILQPWQNKSWNKQKLYLTGYVHHKICLDVRRITVNPLTKFTKIHKGVFYLSLLYILLIENKFLANINLVKPGPAL